MQHLPLSFVDFGAIPLALLYLSFFASPLCVVYIWTKRLITVRTSGLVKCSWRQSVLIGAQVMVTAAVSLVWYWLIMPTPLTEPSIDKFLRISLASVALAISAMLGALIGKGEAKRTTTASSVLVIVNWLAFAAFQ